MKSTKAALVCLLFASLCLSNQLARADIWCSAYYPGYEQTAMPGSAIDFTAITHLVHFSVFPGTNGTLSLTNNDLTNAFITDAVTSAHAANKKVLICVGGAGSAFQTDTSTYLTTFILNLTNFMATNGYDGIDVDWEPLNDSDGPLFTNFVSQLRVALNAFSQYKLLTIAVPPAATPSLIASVQTNFDHINLMTYDLSGPYSGWVTWFNSPIYNAGITFPTVPGEYVPSIDALVDSFAASGIPLNKLGIGAAFYGDIWTGADGTSTGGATEPDQSWTTTPSVTPVTYNQIVSSNFSASQYHYDSDAQSAYYTVTNAVDTSECFIPFDDQRTCQAKVSYARNRGLGGLIIFELGQDHQPGRADPLLQAITEAFATPGPLAIKSAGQNVTLSFASAPLGSYNLQWTSNLMSPTWNSLLITNLSLTSTGGVIQAADTQSLSQPRRFYRVKTPP